MNLARVMAIILMLAAMAGGGRTAAAQTSEYVPDELEGVGIDEHLDGQVPLDLAFKDENGRDITLADYFNKDKPVVLSLIYFNCPMLCTLVLNGTVDALQDIEWTPGKEFEMVTVSFNPAEGPTMAKLKKQNYIKDYGAPQAARGWHFLTGEQEAITALTESVGFNYKWVEERQEFAHAAAVFVLTPDGRISRYLYGVAFDPQTVKLSLLEASDGKIGSTIDRVLLYCYSYDPASGTYAPVAINIMRLSGVVVLIALAIILIPLWLRDLNRKKHKTAEGTPQ